MALGHHSSAQFADLQKPVLNTNQDLINPVFGFCKNFEKLIFTRLMSFLSKYDILTEYQYGFLQNKSTELAENAIINNVVKTFKNKESYIFIHHSQLHQAKLICKLQKRNNYTKSYICSLPILFVRISSH